MSHDELIRCLNEYADRAYKCKTKKEADDLWNEIERFIIANDCDNLETADIFMTSGASDRLHELRTGTEFKGTPTKPKW